ncbi:hypothetical protein EV121DRAFT_263479 [Schizophyllum commune]
MYNPYGYDSYYSNPYQNPYQQRARAAALARERERALEEQRQREAMRNKYFPDGYYDGNDDDYAYNWGRHPYGYVDPREQAYLEAQRLRELEERRLRELELQRQREEEELRLRALAEQRRREYEAALRQRALEQEKQRLAEEERLRAFGREQSRQRRTLQQPQAPRRIPVVSPRLSPAPQPQQRQPSPKRTSPPSPPKPQFTEEEEEAATKIQTFFRIQRALRSVRALHAKFVALKDTFRWPSKVDFVARAHDEEVVSLPLPPDLLASLPPADDLDSEAKLAYTPNNVPLHGYTESLNRLLVELDGVDSFGRREVRERRKEVVREVEKECAAVENTWKGLWKAHLEGKVQPLPEEKKQDTTAASSAQEGNAPVAEATAQATSDAPQDQPTPSSAADEEDTIIAEDADMDAGVKAEEVVQGKAVTEEVAKVIQESVKAQEEPIIEEPQEDEAADTRSVMMADPDAETKSIVMADAEAEEGWENVEGADTDAWGIETPADTPSKEETAFPEEKASEEEVTESSTSTVPASSILPQAREVEAARAPISV